MLAELLVKLAVLTDESKSEVYLNQSVANEEGLDLTGLRAEFADKTGRTVRDNENIKVQFDAEGQTFDFSTFDGVTIRVPYNEQMAAPNKGTDSPVGV